MKNLSYLTCPCRKKIKLIESNNTFLCKDINCIHATPQRAFPVFKDKPVIISEENCDTVCSMIGGQTYVARSSEKLKGLKKFIFGESNVTVKNCKKFVNELLQKRKNPKVLVIGSGEPGSGTDSLWNNKNIKIVGVDIYASKTVDVICDAHYLPFEEETFDAVWIQAVLEHVVEPQVVIQEIFRILKPGGLVYAETPFMQQVHEGPYDFTRFTVLGHRYLFKKFESISYGANGGPEIVMAWSIKYLAWAITNNSFFGKIVGTATSFILRPLKILYNEKALFDSSSGVFFFGCKNEEFKLRHKDLIKLYNGNIKKSNNTLNRKGQ